MQMALMSKLTAEKPLNNKTGCLKRGSAKEQITFVADNFCEPLVDFIVEGYTLVTDDKAFKQYGVLIL